MTALSIKPKFLPLLIGLLSLGLINCSKDKVDTAEESIVGKWVTSDYNSGHNDTIHFASDQRVKDYFLFPRTALYPADAYFYTYSIKDDKIEITSHQPEYATYSETFRYGLKGNSLVLHGFSNPFSVTLEARTDVRFVKLP